MTDKQPTETRIPEFSSIEEEAEFWDTHDFTDFEDEFKPVRLWVAEDLGHIISIPLDSKASRALSAIAKERGVDSITLARDWILERLKETQPSP